jgi:hypothetical protein
MRVDSWVLKYLVVAVAANGLVGIFGPWVLPLTAVLLIPFELSARDVLHEKWNGSPTKMGLLVLAGSTLSWLVAPASVCVASAAGFFASGAADWSVYELLRSQSRRVKMLASNAVAAIVDSLTFQFVAFGVISLEVLSLQCFLKIVGGTFYVWLFTKYRGSDGDLH